MKIIEINNCFRFYLFLLFLEKIHSLMLQILKKLFKNYIKWTFIHKNRTINDARKYIIGFGIILSAVF